MRPANTQTINLYRFIRRETINYLSFILLFPPLAEDPGLLEKEAADDVTAIMAEAEDALWWGPKEASSKLEARDGFLRVKVKFINWIYGMPLSIT